MGGKNKGVYTGKGNRYAGAGKSGKEASRERGAAVKEAQKNFEKNWNADKNQTPKL
jgi:hypothetical protein